MYIDTHIFIYTTHVPFGHINIYIFCLFVCLSVWMDRPTDGGREGGRERYIDGCVCVCVCVCVRLYRLGVYVRRSLGHIGRSVTQVFCQLSYHSGRLEVCSKFGFRVKFSTLTRYGSIGVTGEYIVHNDIRRGRQAEVCPW